MAAKEKREASEMLLIEGTTLVRCCATAGEIEIPDGVTEIGDTAFFALKNITRVRIPQSVARIGKKAFSYCLSIEELVLPDGVTEIGSHAFSNCLALKKVHLPSGLLRIADGMLLGCRSLEHVTLPQTVTEIGESAFFRCESLKEIALPSGLMQVGESAFGDCFSLSEISFPTGIDALPSRVVAGCRSLISAELPATLRSIGNGAFNACASLASIELPSGVERIGSGAFAYCRSLSHVCFPRSVKELAEDCIDGLEPPVTVIMEDARLFGMLSTEAKLLAVSGFLLRYDEGKTDEEECRVYGAFIKKQRKGLAHRFGYDPILYRFLTERNLLTLTAVDELLRNEPPIEIKTVLLEYKNRVATPEMLARLAEREERRIERMLWGGARTVAEWRREFQFSKLRDGTILIERYLGEGSVVEVPECIGRTRVKMIGNYAFSECKSVTDVIISEGIENIFSGAFQDCEGLCRVMLPESISYIATSAFDGCLQVHAVAAAGSYAAKRLREPPFSVVVEED